MRKIFYLLIVANLYCSTVKSKVEFNDKVKCSEKTLSLYIGYSESNNINTKRADAGLKEPDFSKEILSKRIQFYDIKDKLQKSCLFKKIEFDSRNSDYTMEIYIDYHNGINWFSYFGTFASILVTGFWIIPFNANYEMKVTISLSENKTKNHWNKKQDDEITTWVHPLLIFAIPFYGLDRAQNIITANIVNSIVKDLSGKEFLYK